MTVRHFHLDVSQASPSPILCPPMYPIIYPSRYSYQKCNWTTENSRVTTANKTKIHFLTSQVKLILREIDRKQVHLSGAEGEQSSGRMGEVTLGGQEGFFSDKETFEQGPEENQG